MKRTILSRFFNCICSTLALLALAWSVPVRATGRDDADEPFLDNSPQEGEVHRDCSPSMWKCSEYDYPSTETVSLDPLCRIHRLIHRTECILGSWCRIWWEDGSFDERFEPGGWGPDYYLERNDVVSIKYEGQCFWDLVEARPPDARNFSISLDD